MLCLCRPPIVSKMRSKSVISNSHIIHRDPNPSNIMFENGEVTGFIDFVISERNVRLFDPCYCATGILSEAETIIPDGYDQWPIVSSIVRNFPSGSHRTKLHYAWLRYAEESLS
jgi:serine/threonine protein kinase